MMSSIQCPVRSNAVTIPQGVAVLAGERLVTWQEMDGIVNHAAQKLSELAEPEATVAVQMPNGLGLLALILAALRTGHVIAPLSTRLPANGVAERVRLIGAASVVTEHSPAVSESVDQMEIPLDRPATIVFTSGSTGHSKAALHTVRNHIASAAGLREAIPLADTDRWLLNLPLCHVGGLGIVYRCTLAGATIVLPNADDGINSAIGQHNITHASLVSTQLIRLMRDNAELASLKAILLGGSAIPVSLVRDALRQGLPIHSSYGLTEMSSTVSVATPKVLSENPSSSGTCLPKREVQVRDGEICVRGETLFAGYVSGSTLSQPLTTEGWFETGDLGSMDDAGQLTVLGRRDNMFVSGGENIQPETIERALEASDLVHRAVVVSVGHDEFGFRPVAFVEADEGASIEQLKSELASTLPRFMIPDEFYPIPTDGGMKPTRMGLSELAQNIANKKGDA